MERIRQRVSGSYALSITATGSDGLATPISGSATVQIYDGAGTAVYDEPQAAEIVGDALTFSAPVDDLALMDAYEARWTGTAAGEDQEWSTFFEICGGYLFEIPALRAWKAELSDTDAFTTEVLREIRTAAEERFENTAMVAFVPRAARETLYGDGSRALSLSRVHVSSVYSVSVDGTALSEDDLAELVVRSHGLVQRPAGKCWGRDTRVEIHYVHGHPRPMGPVVAAVLMLAADSAIKSNTPSRATSESTEFGTFRFTIAGRDGDIGLPDVDAIATQFGAKRPPVG